MCFKDKRNIYNADLTRMVGGHEIWLGEARRDGKHAEIALFYGDNMRPDGFLDPKSLNSIVYRPDRSTIKPFMSSDKERHILSFPCERDGCYTAIVDLNPVVFTETNGGWRKGPKFQFKDAIHSHVIIQMAKRIIPVGEGRLEQNEPLHGVLEIVPSEAKVFNGGVANLRVFYEGKPLPGAELRAVSKKEGKEMLQTKTDDQGWIRVPLTEEEDWMFMAIHKDSTKSVSNEYDRTTFLTTLVMDALKT